MPNKVFYDADARDRVLEGAKLLYDAVKTTMGPRGRNVVIAKQYGGLSVTHDGVTVAKAVNPKEDEDNLGIKTGADLIKQASNKLNDLAGDGTTTVTVLTYHILKEANRLIAAGYSPMVLRRELEIASQTVLQLADEFSEDIGDNQSKLAAIAGISGGSAKIGALVAEVMHKIGKDGVVSVEEGQGLDLESEVVQGFIADRGYISPFMVTDNSRMEAIYTKPAIVVVSGTIDNMQSFLPLLEKLVQAGKKDLLLIADDVTGDALGSLILNKLKGMFNTIAIKSPSFGDERAEVLEDIAILTGATVINLELGTTFDSVDLDVIGSARKVIVTKDRTTIVEGMGSASDLQDRIRQLDGLIEKATSEHNKERLQIRKAALLGQVAIIKIGGATETEIEEEKYRVDDAVAATKAAMADGVVVGGGATMARLSQLLVEDDAGSRLLAKALLQPFRQLMYNSGLQGEVLLNYLLKSDKTDFGYDVTDPNPDLINLREAGILDPTRVLKESIRSAVSIAGTAITMGALVIEIPEEPKAQSLIPPNMMQVG